MPKILGVRIDDLSWEEAREKTREFLCDGRKHKIFTPNPEMLVLAQEFPNFKKTLNSSDLNLCDGFGITLVSGGKIKRIPGADYVEELCRIAVQENHSVFLLGTEDEKILRKTKEVLTQKISGFNIVGVDIGPKILLDEKKELIIDESFNQEVISKINSSGAEILIVAFGQVKQESWINLYLEKLTNVKIAIGVGGTFNFISGQIKRAPLFVRRMGLEWLYRLWKEPRKRWKRIYNATFKFIFYWITYKIWRKKWM